MIDSSTPIAGDAQAQRLAFPQELGRRFEAVVFDWDGTAVADRQANAEELRGLVERLSALGLDLLVVTGTHVGNVDSQLGARPAGPGRLMYCVNRGSEVYEADASGVRLVRRRDATDDEDSALDAAAAATVGVLEERGIHAEIVSQRLNRRKIDLIPEPEWRDPPKAQIEALLAAVEQRLRSSGVKGIAEAVELASRCAAESGLSDARVTSDAKHVEIGLTDKSDSAEWLFNDLWSRGISPRLVAVVGDEFGPLGGLPGSDSLLMVPGGIGSCVVSVGREPNGTPAGVIRLGGGPEKFFAILVDQLERRERRDTPRVAEDPGWTIAIDGIDPELERAHAALLTLADGRIGTTGAPIWSHSAANPRVFLSGLYDGEGSMTQLLSAPVWNQLARDLPHAARLHRRLNMHEGVQHQTASVSQDTAEAVLFSSAAWPGIVALRASGPAALVGAGAPLRAAPGLPAEEGKLSGLGFVRVPVGPGGLCAAVREQVEPSGVERIGAYITDPAMLPAASTAAREVRVAADAGFERLLREHRAAWARRWVTADIEIHGDDELQIATRFALFHLMGSAASEGEAAVGARGLSGEGYRGHVFWDTDVFVLPFLAATHPAAARAVLEYRIRRMPAAIAAAREMNLDGARFPWESAGDGRDVTPRSVHDRSGRLVRIRTGECEEHIVADIAWAACTYVDWTNDQEFAAGAGLNILIETARYWVSRVRIDNHSDAHIYGVIGPDEYHEPVDDNAFTNLMARWNLRRAADAVDRYGGGAEQERARWLHIANTLVDGFRPDIGVHEEFAGFFKLEPLVIADIAPHRPVAADLLLGHERVSNAQVVKQADVLMAHHLIPDDMPAGSLGTDLAYYEPRTAHGSTLSPAIHAALMARAGRLGRAVQALKLAAMVDLDDVTNTTGGGLHIATMGGLWQALVFGFAGVTPHPSGLTVSPRLPEQWEQLSVRLQFRGVPVRIAISHDGVDVQSDAEIEWNVEQ